VSRAVRTRVASSHHSHPHTHTHTHTHTTHTTTLVTQASIDETAIRAILDQFDDYETIGKLKLAESTLLAREQGCALTVGPLGVSIIHKVSDILICTEQS
jgi:hypothetical protein